jgi:membrane protein implicated in regulation of membrane protease activity
MSRRLVSPKLKFILITVDELVLVPVAIVLVYFFVPELLVPVSILSIAGAIVFVAIKYYVVYPTLAKEGSYGFYEVSGLTGIVTVSVTQTSGKIKVGSEIWDARCDEGEIPIGADVQILSRDSFKVRVAPIEK